MNQNCQVVIVGAGISGLAAAKTLIESGISSIKVLEAQSVPGGRVQTLCFEEFCIELGAQYIHGEVNEVFDICKASGLIEGYSEECEGYFFRENGETVSEDLVKEVDDVIRNILEDCEGYISEDTDRYPHSVGEEVTSRFHDYLRKTNDSEETKTIKLELLDWHIRYHLIDNCCTDLNNLSAKCWGLFEFCGGRDYVTLRHGYSSFVNVLVDDIPEDVIIYNTPVERIVWKDNIPTENFNLSDSFASVICENGSVYNTQYVIVTSSLGYLKSNYKKMFTPQLPGYLTEAIECLDFGIMNKIFLMYSKSWWDTDTKGFQLLWSQEGSPIPSDHWGRWLTGFDVIKDDKPYLLGWIGGEGAKFVETLPEDEVGVEATKLLQHFTKDPDIPFPVKVVVTKWWSNPYIRGAYCHIPIQCDESDITTASLAQPAYTTMKGKKKYKKPTILLAGEAAHETHYSTVHGAFESGKTQAHVIINHLLMS